MNDEAEHLDQADEEILTYTVSDETLEAAAGAERAGHTIGIMSDPICCA